MALGERVLPRALIEGFEEGVAREAMDATLGPKSGTAEEPARRSRARAALTPLLQEAFSPEFLAGVAAQRLARRYSAEELRALRAREDSPLGRKVRDSENRSKRVPTPTRRSPLQGRGFLPPDLQRRRAKGAREVCRFSPGRKVEEVGPELARHFLEALDPAMGTGPRRDGAPDAKGGRGGCAQRGTGAMTGRKPAGGAQPRFLSATRVSAP